MNLATSELPGDRFYDRNGVAADRAERLADYAFGANEGIYDHSPANPPAERIARNDAAILTLAAEWAFPSVQGHAVKGWSPAKLAAAWEFVPQEDRTKLLTAWAVLVDQGAIELRDLLADAGLLVPPVDTAADDMQSSGRYGFAVYEHDDAELAGVA